MSAEAIAHAIAADAARAAGFTGLAEAHVELVRRELCACGPGLCDAAG